MRRKTFDALLATGGVVVAAMLLVAGGLLVWAHSFINDQVETQLSAQQIYWRGLEPYPKNRLKQRQSLALRPSHHFLT